MGGPRQPDPGTQPGCYRCSLPGLTGFTAGCRGGTDADHRYFISLSLGRAISPAMMAGAPNMQEQFSATGDDQGGV